MQEGKWLSEEALQRAEQRREVKGKKDRKRYIQLNAKFQRKSKGNEEPFLNEECKEIEENNRIRKIGKKIGDIKGTLHARMGTIKNRNDKDLTETEEIKKRRQEYTEG